MRIGSRAQLTVARTAVEEIDAAADAALAARARTDPTAFAPLYRKYVGPVFRFCYAELGTREVAEDATALAFERALRGLPSYRGGSFRAWLFSIAHNVIVDSRRTARRTALLEEAELIVDPDPPPDELAVLADERRLLLTALPLLPDEQRRVIELRLAGLAATEVARVLDRSPEAIRSAQLRAVRRLQGLLNVPVQKEVRDA